MTEVNRHTMFLREHIILPGGIALAAKPFCDGWIILNSGDALWLEKKVTALGWNFIALTGLHLRDGIARSVPEAIHKALRVALQSISRDFNAAEVEKVETARRLWLCIAKARLSARHIQESPFLGANDDLLVHHEPQTFEAGDQRL